MDTELIAGQFTKALDAVVSTAPAVPAEPGRTFRAGDLTPAEVPAEEVAQTPTPSSTTLTSKETNLANLRKLKEAAEARAEAEAARVAALRAKVGLADSDPDDAVEIRLKTIREEAEAAKREREALADEIGKRDVTRSRLWQQEVEAPLNETLELLTTHFGSKTEMDKFLSQVREMPTDPAGLEARRQLLKSTSRDWDIPLRELMKSLETLDAVDAKAADLQTNWRTSIEQSKLAERDAALAAREEQISLGSKAREAAIQSALMSFEGSGLEKLGKYDDWKKYADKFHADVEKAVREPASVDTSTMMRRGILGQWVMDNLEEVVRLAESSERLKQLDAKLPFKNGATPPPQVAPTSTYKILEKIASGG